MWVRERNVYVSFFKLKAVFETFTRAFSIMKLIRLMSESNKLLATFTNFGRVTLVIFLSLGMLELSVTVTLGKS